MNFGDEFEAEVGASQVLARFAQSSGKTAAAMLPFASVAWRGGNSTVRYSVATVPPGMRTPDDTAPRAWLPRLSERSGNLALEHGIHQEIGWERQTDLSAMSVKVFADKIDNPVLEAMAHFAAGGDAASSALYDSASGLLRAAGPDFSTAGMIATAERRLPGGNNLRISYANGDALVLSAAPTGAQRSATLAQVLAAARPRHAQMYALSLSGTLDGTGTHWRASYRWQPADTVTQVAPYALDAAEPYLNLHIRQPIHLLRDGSGGVEALFDLRNLLAQGYQPYILSDGSVVVFAQDQRAIQAGLAFTF